MKALYDNVLIRINGSPDKTPGGLYIPDIAKDSDYVRNGVIVSIGSGTEGRPTEPYGLNVGETVMYLKSSARSITIDRVLYDMVPIQFIVAVVDQGDEQGQGADPPGHDRSTSDPGNG